MAVEERPMSEEGLERQAIDYFALVAARDAAGMERFWGPAPVWEMLALGATLGPSEARAFFGGLFAAIPDLETTVERVTTGAQTT
ncbi:MAG: nuclear transport factor 2 family protein, partial [Thermoleophilaceae bacterium]